MVTSGREMKNRTESDNARRTFLHPPPRKLNVFHIVRLMDALLVAVSVVIPVIARVTEDRSVIFCLSLTVFFVPLSPVVARHVVALAFFGKSAKYGEFMSAAIKVYYPLVFGSIGVMLSQLIVPGQFKGSDSLLVLIIVLVLAKIDSVHEVIRCFRRLAGKRNIINSRSARIKVGRRRRRSCTPTRRKRVAGSGLARSGGVGGKVSPMDDLP
ncbi:hypothetical protein QRX50_27925 [Amycolatopsis carbonis]|uniref:Uncharacterized protein n=1 Tax=Amycolatopsis carbonis TaxID=715471 RepID=A0A9Y2I996_9PSEU|nr:hypothetical protein [Amycolatopsis sp. 2-15]WIX75349.1 hypothetical protein QRX50_27925 [Amycolatopsis sp. 2-15]